MFAAACGHDEIVQDLLDMMSSLDGEDKEWWMDSFDVGCEVQTIFIVWESC